MMMNRYCPQIQTNIATSLGLTLKPYFSLKHCINRFKGEADPKSTWLEPTTTLEAVVVAVSTLASKPLDNSSVACLNSSWRWAIS